MLLIPSHTTWRNILLWESTSPVKISAAESPLEGSLILLQLCGHMNLIVFSFPLLRSEFDWTEMEQHEHEFIERLHCLFELVNNIQFEDVTPDADMTLSSLFVFPLLYVILNSISFDEQ